LGAVERQQADDIPAGRMISGAISIDEEGLGSVRAARPSAD
jgi:hypothetical protein